MLKLKKILTLTLALVFAVPVISSVACSTNNGHEHVWGEWTTVKQATCTKAGSQKRICELDSSHVETQAIKALGHDYEWSIISPATCMSNGSQQGICKNDPSHTATESLPADTNAHTWVGDMILTSPSCTSEGTRVYRCEHNDSHTITKTIPVQHEWLEWELISSPTCTEAGSKKRVCSIDGTEETAPIAPLGHHYKNGVCEVCQAGPIFPDEPVHITYVDPAHPDSEIIGAGEDFNRYELAEGYYELDIPSSEEVWISFSARRTGQYALYSTSNSANVTATRYDASAHYINPDGEDAVVLDDGNFYSSVNLDSDHFSLQWRATYALRGTAGSRVKFRFVRIDDELRGASKEYTVMYPQQLMQKAADQTGYLTREVDFSTEYHFNEATGYYETAEGKTIYAAITVNAPRLLESGSLADLPVNNISYSFYKNTAVDGTRQFLDYAWFLTNYGGLGTFDDSRNFVPNEGNPNALCYQNYVNSDGLYPVNQELYEFLNLYVALHTPVGLMSSFNPEASANAWLAACYEYYDGTPGSEEFPITVSETFTAELGFSSDVYYVFRAPEGADANAIYVLSCDHNNAWIEVNNQAYSGAFSIEVRSGTVFRLSTDNGRKDTYTITVTEKV